MKIFTAAQIKSCDQYTIQQDGISSIALMERAAAQCKEWIINRYDRETPILVLCGMGNNGGDGLALTRLLLNEGFSAKAVVLRHAEQFATNTSENLSLLHEMAPDAIQILEPGLFVTELPEDILIVEALFGTGLNRPLDGWPAWFINELNQLPNQKISIDIPAGLPADNLPETGAIVMQADYTLSFQFYKRSFLHIESEHNVGHIQLLNIGLSKIFQEVTPAHFFTIDQELIRSFYRKRSPYAHKGNYGKAMLIGGSYGKMGAIALSTRAALRSGAGLVYTQAPECGYHIAQTLNPEAMFLSSGVQHVEELKIEEEQFTIGIGPGLGKHPETVKAFLSFLESYKLPLVLDADAINILADHPEAMHLIPPASILTPHPKEMERLFGVSQNSMQQVELARSKAMKYNIYIVLKGRHTAVLGPSGVCWYNTTGNPGMATGGSGDVLTGIITGLLAQHYSAQDAALMGVYLHGLAGDQAAVKRSEEALVAGDITEYIGEAFLLLQSAS